MLYCGAESAVLFALLVDVKRVVTVENYFAFAERGLNVDEALVAAAAEKEVGVVEFLHKFAVYKHVEVFEKVAHLFVPENLLVGEAGVTPNGLVGLLLNHLGKFGKRCGLIKRVAARECYVRHFVAVNLHKKVFHVNGLSVHNVPRLWVLTVATLVVAA